MNTKERDNFARAFTEEKLDKADDAEISDFSNLADLNNCLEILKNLIEVPAKGFRGIVATAIVGLAVNPKYDPLSQFYDCNPRSIFENGIFYAFRNRIPCGKSDPLNVAKNVNALDEGWIKGKRPEKAARAAVDYLRKITQASGKQQVLLVDLFYYKLVEYAKSISTIRISAPSRNVISNQEFSFICNKLINEYPESGAIPQFIINELIGCVFEKSQTTVQGGLESVFGTNTTSKKPADLWLEIDGKPTNLFEVTVKKVGFKRLDDCFDNLEKLNLLHLPVQFICRLPQDVSELGPLSNGGILAQGKLFGFQDIGEFVRATCSLLSASQIAQILTDIDLFMKNIERPVKTKQGWNAILFSIETT